MQFKILIVGLALLLISVSAVAAEGGKEGGGQAQNAPPAMLVAVEKIVEGTAEPSQQMVGTVFYSRVSNVASEVGGLVASVAINDGDRVKKGASLVTLQTDILETMIDKTRNSFEQAVIDMEQARKDLTRLESLHSDNLIAETTYDNQMATARGLEKRAAALKADLDRLQLEKKKMTIDAPFSGVVLKKEVEQGEWVNAGGTVAVVADDRQVDVVVDIPERMVGLLEKGREVAIISGDKKYTGRYVALIPRGDIATRTFSIKLRLKNTDALIEGMAARALLPVSPAESGLLVPRDAVINKFGRDVVYIVEGGLAKMIPVEVTGYSGLQFGVSGDGLKAGQDVIIKGQERIYNDGTPVRFGS
ncbi:MAG: efflux RND transporter periplasmic adaptor subunit [Desulfuromonas sp.]|nr:MAG: efflux RND transporter periplasmic adaptor subunit [Desulfuromonas sp.]